MVTLLTHIHRRTRKDSKQRWRLRIPNSSRKMINSGRKMINSGRMMINSGRKMINSGRKMINSSNKVQNSERGLLKSTGNRGSYKH